MTKFDKVPGKIVSKRPENDPAMAGIMAKVERLKLENKAKPQVATKTVAAAAEPVSSVQPSNQVANDPSSKKEVKFA